jgi:hypothetical protein
VRKIAQDEVLNHLFNAQINKSVAEGTIKRYTVKCWGCDQTGHSFANKQGQITCPNKDKPGVQDRAAKARKDFNERLQKRKQESRKKRGVNNMLTEAFGSLTGDEIRALVASSSPAKKTKNSPSGAVQTFIVCYEVNSSVKPMLPISIKSRLPHIVMPIGQNHAASLFSLPVAYDTCAACNVGYLGHHLPIAEKFPELVKSLVYAEDKYAPLTLSAIITENKENGVTSMKPTATLPAIVEYWPPFLMKEGHRTELKIALGKFVSVNTIIGMPMIKPAKLSLDLIDSVVESGVLDTEPFPVIYRPTIQSKPDFSKIGSNDTKLLTTNSDKYGHITSSDATACSVALANWDYSIVEKEPTAKRVKFDTASIDDPDDTAAVYPPSTS